MTQNRSWKVRDVEEGDQRSEVGVQHMLLLLIGRNGLILSKYMVSHLQSNGRVWALELFLVHSE